MHVGANYGGWHVSKVKEYVNTLRNFFNQEVGESLTADEIRLLLDLIQEKHGPGYASVPEVARLQGKLSIMLAKEKP